MYEFLKYKFSLLLKYIIGELPIDEEELQESLNYSSEKYLKKWANSEGSQIVTDNKSAYIDLIVDKYKQEGLLKND